MADGTNQIDLSNANLNLTSEEKRAYGQLFQQADTDGLGVVTGDVAVKFFERTRLDSTVLGEIWQIADTENRGLLTPIGFSIVLRLIGHCQAGRDATPEMALRPGPLPHFYDLNAPIHNQPIVASPTAIQPQISGPIRVPPLTPDKISQYTSLFETAGARDGLLSGDAAKQFFEKQRLPNEILGKIWTLADTDQRGALGATQFIIAMHLLTSIKSGVLRTLPQTLPPGLYEAASRRGQQPPTTASIPRQFSGQNAQRTASPLARAPYVVPAQAIRSLPMSIQSTGNEWLVTPAEKAKYDQLFATVDKTGAGFITGDEAVQFFSNSGLSEDTLASIWDLADINSEGKLNSDEFAVAMYLIRQQRAKKDGRGDVPSALPAALVPPNMRQRAIPPQHATAPAFDNAAFATQQPKSAADDLFGLDALSSDIAPSGQSTGAFEPDPFAGGSPVSPPPTRGLSSPARSLNTSFKPFVPTSSFGQGLASQTTGGSVQSNGSQSRAITQTRSTPADDLLGDNDQESNSKITQDTTELANMSNQIGILHSQMQSVQTKKSTVETEVTQTSKQKKDLELRLSQFRTQYEQEIKTVKNLEEQLAASRAETRKMQQEFATVDGAFKDLRAQHQTTAAALEADQHENASLKDRIRQLNADTAELRLQLEKLKSDARQQRGLVAINKKQLATSEVEREKLQSEVQSTQAQNAEATRDIPVSQEQAIPSVTSPVPSVASQSTNPFFRNTPQQPLSNPMSPSGFTPDIASLQGKTAFDSVFGPTPVTTQNTGPPPTTFRSVAEQSVPSTEAVEGSRSIPPPKSSFDEESSQYSAPATPSEPRQVATSVLPLHSGIGSTDSLSSSVKANPPTSPFDGSRAGTPIPLSAFPTPGQSRDVSSMQGGQEPPSLPPQDEPMLPNSASHVPEATPKTSDLEATREPVDTPQTRDFSADSIPGAFPAESSTPVALTPTGGSARSLGPTDDSAMSQLNPFAETDNGVTQPSSTKGAFDSTFESFEDGQDSSMTGTARGTTSDSARLPTAVSMPNTKSEFPPIQDLNEDDESDSDDEPGFEDNFTAASPPNNHDGEGHVQADTNTEARGESQTEDLANTPVHIEDGGSAEAQPSEEAASQISPPSYDRSVVSRANGNTRDSNRSPSEFGGQLPSREISSSPPESVPQASQPGFLASIFGAKTATAEPNGSVPGPSSTIPTLQNAKVTGDDEFDSAFEDLSEAKEVDDHGPDDFGVGSIVPAEHEFDPTFDSPAPSKKSTMTEFQQTPVASSVRQLPVVNSSEDFSPSISGATQAFYSSKPQQSRTSNTADWDEMFAGLDDSREAGTGPDNLHETQVASGSITGQSAAPSILQRPPPPGRALTAGTEHDDPILQRLTGMGYPRTDALKALEKYDYNIEKAADYLTSRS